MSYAGRKMRCFSTRFLAIHWWERQMSAPSLGRALSKVVKVNIAGSLLFSLSHILIIMSTSSVPGPVLSPGDKADRAPLFPPSVPIPSPLPHPPFPPPSFPDPLLPPSFSPTPHSSSPPFHVCCLAPPLLMSCLSIHKLRMSEPRKLL